MTICIFALIVLEVILNSAAQLSLKEGMGRIGHFDFTWHNALPIFTQVIFSFWIWIGILIYVVSMIVWLMVLSRAEVSVAYPLTSMGYIISAVAAYFLFSDHLSLVRITGILVILFGVILISRS